MIHAASIGGVTGSAWINRAGGSKGNLMSLPNTPDTPDTDNTPAAPLSAAAIASQSVILTGDRPTGPLHLGHFVGSLRNRVAYQHSYKQFIMLADAQALTDNMDDTNKVHRNVVEVALDYLAVGIDPTKTTILIQSQIRTGRADLLLPEHGHRGPPGAQPDREEEIALRGFERDIPAGFLTYPASQRPTSRPSRPRWCRWAKTRSR
jgi:tryptophanyl-tRNA synthetase